MALNLGRLFFQIGADTKGLQKANRDVQKFTDTTKKGMVGVRREISLLQTSFIALGGIYVGGRIIKLADDYKNLQQRIKTATRATGDYAQVSSALYAISQRNGIGLAENVNLFQSLARVAPELGATTDEMLTLSDAVGQLGVIGGSTNEQLKNGLLQFTQGLAAGVFRAEEMNSLLENIPEVANRIARGMGMTSGELRKAVLEGTVLSEDVFQSLLKQAPEIAKEFANIPQSIGRAQTALANSASKFFGELGVATGLTENIANAMKRASVYIDNIDVQALADNLQRVAYWAGAFVGYKVAFLAIRSIMALTAGATASWAGALTLVRKALIKTGLGAIVVLLGELAWQFTNVGDLTTTFGRNFEKAGIYASSAFDSIKNHVSIFLLDLLNISERVKIIFGGVWDAVSGGGVSALKGIGTALEEQNAMYEANYLKAQARFGLIAQEREADLADLKVRVSEAIAVSADGEKKKASAVQQIATESNTAMVAREYGWQTEATARNEAQNMTFLEKLVAFRDKLEELHTAGERRLTDKLWDIENQYYSRKEKLQASADFLQLQNRKRLSEQTLGEQASTFRSAIDSAAQHNKEFFRLQKALRLASAVIDGYSAIVSAYQFGTAIGGPLTGSIFAGIAGAATAIQISAIRASTYSGKAVGGSASMGGLYKVNEAGPEMLSVGGEDFLMMGSQGGNITPNNKLKGKQGNSVTVNVYPIEGETARVEQRETDEGFDIAIFIEQIENNIAGGIARGGSNIADALERQYALNRSAGATR